MSKHHVEDIDDDVRIRVAYIASGPPQHAKNEKADLYPAFAGNIVENQRRWEDAAHMANHAAIAAAVMNLSRGKWNLEWEVH